MNSLKTDSEQIAFNSNCTLIHAFDNEGKYLYTYGILKGKNMRNLVPVVVTPSGIFATWERGGGHRNSGNALCISDNFGKRKKALYIKKYTIKTCKEHALLPIEEDDAVCSIKLWKKKETRIWQWHTRISKVIGFTKIGNEIKASVKTIEEFITDQNSEKTDISNPLFEDLYNATLNKALEYHCRTPKFIR